MKVTKSGIKVRHVEYSGTCMRCKCEFDCNTSELDWNFCEPYAICPECKVKVFLSELIQKEKA